MKKSMLLSLAFLAFLCLQQVVAQTPTPVVAVPTATSVKATQIQPPTYSTPLWIGSAWKYEDPCNQVFLLNLGGACNVGPDDPRYYLDQFNFATGNWTLNFRPYQSCNEFTNLPHGTYRIRVQRPVDANGAGGCEGGHIKVYNTAGQFIGWRGAYVSNTAMATSNSVVVGAAVQSDISCTFVDIQTPTNYLFNSNQAVVLNTAGTINYDRWWLAIFEKGGQNRYWSQGWTFGPIPNNLLNLTNLVGGAFGGGANGFEPFTTATYQVQFAIATGFNEAWVECPSTFNVCPPGLNCRSVDDEPIAISPNPASSSFHIMNLDLNTESTYSLTVTDLSGRTVKSYAQIAQEDVDIDDLSNGLYIVNIMEGDNRIYTSKLSVVK